MFFLDKNLTSIMKEAFSWDDDQIQGMNYLYFDTIFKLIINDTIEFLEGNAPEDLKKVRAQTQVYTISKNPEDQIKLLQFIFGLSDKHLKLQKHLMTRLNKINADLIEDFVEAMDYESGLKLIEIMDKELNDVRKFEEKFLLFAKEKEEKSI
jgi:hypothetical protein